MRGSTKWLLLTVAVASTCAQQVFVGPLTFDEGSAGFTVRVTDESNATATVGADVQGGNGIRVVVYEPAATADAVVLQSDSYQIARGQYQWSFSGMSDPDALVYATVVNASGAVAKDYFITGGNWTNYQLPFITTNSSNVILRLQVGGSLANYSFTDFKLTGAVTPPSPSPAVIPSPARPSPANPSPSPLGVPSPSPSLLDNLQNLLQQQQGSKAGNGGNSENSTDGRNSASKDQNNQPNSPPNSQDDMPPPAPTPQPRAPALVVAPAPTPVPAPAPGSGFAQDDGDNNEKGAPSQQASQTAAQATPVSRLGQQTKNAQNDAQTPPASAPGEQQPLAADQQNGQQNTNSNAPQSGQGPTQDGDLQGKQGAGVMAPTPQQSQNANNQDLQQSGQQGGMLVRAPAPVPQPLTALQQQQVQQQQLAQQQAEQQQLARQQASQQGGSNASGSSQNTATGAPAPTAASAARALQQGQNGATSDAPTPSTSQLTPEQVATLQQQQQIIAQQQAVVRQQQAQSQQQGGTPTPAG